MRALLNGRDIGALDERLARRLSGRPTDKVIEAVVISPEASIAARAGQLRVLLGAVAGLVAFILVLNLTIIVTSVPVSMWIIVLVVAITVVVTGGLVFGLYALMLGDHRKRVVARAASAMTAGTEVRLDATVLRAGGEAWLWPTIKVEELGIRERQGEHQRLTYADWLVLTDGRRTIRLDALFLTNGREVLEQAWRRLQAARPVL
jgi:hypothetical protein